MPASLLGLTKCDIELTTLDGREIDVWELTVHAGVDLTEWVFNFRQNYCTDDEIDAFRDGTGLSRAEYLTQMIFPDQSVAPGPAIRAGDFAELLVSDYIEHILGYWVPREKYAHKQVRNESVKGVDILGLRLASPDAPSPTDILLAFEVKAQLSGSSYARRLQNAIDDSSKDFIRRAYTLNATKQRLLRSSEIEKALRVQRFQNPADHPYLYRSGAAAVLIDSVYDEGQLRESTAAHHLNSTNLELIVIRGSDLMQLVHSLYERAANEA